MKKLYIIITMLFLVLTSHAQIEDYDNGVIFDIFSIENIEERLQIVSALSTNDILICDPLWEKPGKLYIRPNGYNEDANTYLELEYLLSLLKEEFKDISSLPKEEYSYYFESWAENISKEYFEFITSDIPEYRTNNHCMDSEPFCTSDTLTFPATGNGVSWYGPNYGCLGNSPTTKTSFWYHMRIRVAGNINIYMSAGFDIDFALWGPFNDETTPCPTTAGQAGLLTGNCSSCPNNTTNPNFYPSGNLHDCSYSANSYETAHIVNGQVGQYYILLITNFSGGSGNITFRKISGNGETDCGILEPTLNYNDPVCVGGTLNLTARGETGATYSWVGPDGWTSTQQNPTRNNVTMSMAGTYTCNITIGSQQSENAELEVEIGAQPTSNFTFTTVCQGTPTQFNSTSTTNPSGYSIDSYLWNFGEPSSSNNTSTLQNPTHTYSNSGTYTVTLTTKIQTEEGFCEDTETKQVTVYSNPNANAGPDQTIGYGGVATLSGSGGNGTFTYRWEPADKVVNPNAQTTQTRALTQSTTFTLTVSGSSDCTDNDRVTINVDGTAMTASVNADDTELCQGESTTLHATASGGTSNYTYTWNPTTGLSNPSIPNPVASPNITTEYTCTIHDGQTQQTPTITIVVHPQYNDIQDFDEVCQYSGNGYYTSNGFNISTQEAGTFTQTITKQTNFGCDSIVTMNLTVHPAYETHLNESICDGGSYPFFGENLTQEGTYEHTLQSVNGCDSIIILNLSITDQYTKNVFVSTCDEPYTWDWGALGDTVINNSGEYVHTFESLAGCDSVVTLYFERYPNYIGENQIHDYQTHCDVLTWEGEVFYESGDYTKTLRTVNGCDSIVTLHLTINESTESYVVETSCGSFTMLGHSYTNPAHYVDTIHTLNEYGCLEVVNLDLWLHSVPQIDPITGITPPLFFTGTGFDLYEYSIRNASGGGIEQGFPENYEWDLITSESSENWTLIPSENSAIVSLTRPGYAYLYCYVTTECGTDTLWTPLYTMGYEPIGIDEHNAGSLFHIYPNPTNGNVYISYSGLTTNTPVTISVYNSNGLLVKKFDTRFTPSISAVSFSMNEVNNGLYIIKVTGKEFNIYKKLILNK